MKKLLLFIFLLVNLSLQYNNGVIRVCAGQKIFAQACPPSVDSPQERTNFWRWLSNVFRAVGNAASTFYRMLVSALESGGGGGGGGSSQVPDPDGVWYLLNTYSTSYGTPNPIHYGPVSQGGVASISTMDAGWPVPINTYHMPPELPDCAGVMGGSAFLDDCNICVGGTTGRLPCYVPFDCAGVKNGTAYTDSCGKCVGGNTGKLPCIKDCAGIWGGKSYKDSCNVCIDSIRKQPCDVSYKKNGDSLNNFLNRPEFADSLNKFKLHLGTDTVEKAISFGRIGLGNTYKPTSIQKSPNQFQTILINTYPGMSIVKMMHSHTLNAYNCFSNGDMYAFKGVYNRPFPNAITSQYVMAHDSSVYAMYPTV